MSGIYGQLEIAEQKVKYKAYIIIKRDEEITGEL